MSNQNHFVVSGNLGANPSHYKKSEDSKGVVTFNLAQNVSKLNEKAGKYEHAHTNWFPIRVFGSLASRVMSNLKKGDRVTVVGKVRTYQYDEEGGSVHYGFEVIADEITGCVILTKGGSQSLPASNPGDFGEFEEMPL